MYRRLYEAGIYPTAVGAPLPLAHLPPDYRLVGGVPLREWNAFHQLVVGREFARCGSGGTLWGLLGGLTWSLAPILHYGSAEMRERVAEPCLRAQKFICLCITEPGAGSDVAALQGTTASRLSRSQLSSAQLQSAKGLAGESDPEWYVLSGEKKWITNGIWADFFVVVARTESGAGAKGLSLFLVERDRAGLATRRMDCMGVWASGTTFVTLDDVAVPAHNLIGEKNDAFRMIVQNFNHERWCIATHALGLAHTAVDDCLAYVLKRHTFGKPLADHAVIRNKLAHMKRHVDAAWAWLEAVTHQIASMAPDRARRLLGGPVALLKAHSSLTLEIVAREAAQIFGGLAYTRGGQGGKIERIYREVRAYAIPGGSEEILLDLAARQLLRNYASSISSNSKI